MDPERHPTTGPAMHDAEPARVGAQQRVQLDVRPGPEPGQHDVRDALALEVGTVLGRCRSRLGPTAVAVHVERSARAPGVDRKSTRLNSSHLVISYAVFCLKKKKNRAKPTTARDLS